MQQFKKAETTSLSCPNCGSKVDLRLPGKSQALKCEYCGSVIDTQSEQLEIIGKFEQNANIKPLIELGSYGTFENTKFQLIGFLRKRDDDGGKWDEYLLFNPYKGYRYLSNWQGHWNYIKLLQGSAFTDGGSAINLSNYYGKAHYGKRSFKHFYKYEAKVSYVLGEFNWKVKSGETTTVLDYIAPPYALSGEIDAGNKGVVWSLGKYVDRSVIQKAFDLKEKLAKPKYIAPNQPNPNKKKLWGALVLFIASVIGITVFQQYMVSKTEYKLVYDTKHQIDLGKQQLKRQGRNKFREFQLNMGDLEVDGNKPKNFRFKIRTNVNNSWLYLTFFLMNEKNNQGYTFSQEISYYHGYSGGESWTEGSKHKTFVTPYIKPGKYLLMAVGQSNKGYKYRYRITKRNQLKVKIKIIRGYLGYTMWTLAFFGLMIPLLFAFFKMRGFEKKRN